MPRPYGRSCGCDGGDGAARVGVALDALQVGTQVGGALIAEVAILFESFGDDVGQFFGQVGIEANRRNRCAFEDGLEDERGSIPAKGQGAGGHFVENGAEGKEIGAGVEFLAGGLFGGHVGNRAQRGAGASEVFGVDGFGQGIVGLRFFCRSDFGEAEIENLGVAAAGIEDVGRLNVTMNDAGGVGGVESVGDFNASAEQHIGVERTAIDFVLQGDAVKKLHGNERLAIVIADFVDRADIGMVERGCGTGFTAEAFECLGIARESFGKKLQADKASEL